MDDLYKQIYGVYLQEMKDGALGDYKNVNDSDIEKALAKLKYNEHIEDYIISEVMCALDEVLGID